MKGYLFTFIMLLSLFSCVPKDSGKISLLNASAFEKEVNGKLVSLYTIDSGNGLVVQVTNLGLRVVSIWTADKDGEYADVAVGYENIDRYLNNEGERFLGSIVGRYANRISKGRFMIDSVQYQLPLNNNGQTLHGGLKGLDMRVWNVDRISDKSIDFSYVSPDNEEGFPGTLNIKVRTKKLSILLSPQFSSAPNYDHTPNHSVTAHPPYLSCFLSLLDYENQTEFHLPRQSLL